MNKATNERETTGIEVLLSDPEVLAWLEPEEDDEPEDETPERRLQ
jgi:hypothetical protein